MDQVTTTSFTSLLMEWALTVDRDLPWKETQDPYKIWISEIILQQTRVEQGRPYYYRFIERFPDVQTLAAASESSVFQVWEGLGYYSRARNLHHTSKVIVDQYGGIFPNTYDDILALKGIGAYTAAAIGSFAFDLPYAVVDGNVMRVLSRVFGIEEPIDSTLGKRLINALAQDQLDLSDPASYNQAIMDFGAILCTPKKPLCHPCPMKVICYASQNGKVTDLPIKAKKIKRRSRYFHYVYIKDAAGRTYIQQRITKDIWKGLYQFPLLEVGEKGQLSDEVLDNFIKSELQLSPTVKPMVTTARQLLTHQTIFAYFYFFELDRTLDLTVSNYDLVNQQNVSNFAYPKVINTYLANNRLSLF